MAQHKVRSIEQCLHPRNNTVAVQLPLLWTTIGVSLLFLIIFNTGIPSDQSHLGWMTETLPLSSYYAVNVKAISERALLKGFTTKEL